MYRPEPLLLHLKKKGDLGMYLLKVEQLRLKVKVLGQITDKNLQSHTSKNINEENGAAERNRTFDLTLTKGMLYQLSYGSNANDT